jgi:hypothetical protein
VFTGPGNELHSSIRVVRPDGSGLRKVFEDPERGAAIAPSWSPDCHMIMFALHSASAIDRRGLQPNKLCVINADGKGFAVLIDRPNLKSEPDWVGTEGRGG